MRLLIAFLFLFCAGLTSGALAQNLARFGQFSVDPADPTVILLNGEIGETAVLDFRRALAAFPDVNTLVLNSPGGVVVNALLIADMAHERGFSTYIPPKAGCYSACAYIFFAGLQRQA